MTLSETVAMLAREHSETVFAWLFLGSLLEYVFPPFPGDTVTLAGAVLVVLGRLSWTVTFLVLLGGNLVGSALDHAFGRWLAERMTRADPWPSVLDRLRPSLAKALAVFERHGNLALALNRFLPGIRALLFVAAGFAGMPRSKVLALAALSAALWNGLILLVGLALGAHLDRLETWVRNLGLGGWFLLGLVVLGALAVRSLRRRRTSHEPVDRHPQRSDDDRTTHREGHRTP